MIRNLIAFLGAIAWAAVSVAATTVPPSMLNPAGSTSGQVIVSSGASTAPAWGTIGLSGLPSMAANAVLANATAAAATPTAVALPSCSTTASALQWSSGTGFVCNSVLATQSYVTSTFAAPPALGSTTPAAVTATTLTGTSTTNSTSTTTGAAIIAGGMGVAGDIYAGGSYRGGVITTSGSINNVPIGAATPNTGAFTTLSATGAITPSSTAGIVGTTSGNNANAGSVGEFVSANTSSVALTNTAVANVTSISLSAGDWDVWGSVQFGIGSGATATIISCGVSSTSATSPASPYLTIWSFTMAANTNQATPCPMQRFNLSSTTTIYLVSAAYFSGGSVSVGGTILARRRR